jgi:hypothetical protein
LHLVLIFSFFLLGLCAGDPRGGTQINYYNNKSEIIGGACSGYSDLETLLNLLKYDLLCFVPLCFCFC